MLETTCIKRPPALRDHSYDATTLLKSNKYNLQDHLLLKTTFIAFLEWSLNAGYTVYKKVTLHGSGLRMGVVVAVDYFKSKYCGKREEEPLYALTITFNMLTLSQTSPGFYMSAVQVF